MHFPPNFEINKQLSRRVTGGEQRLDRLHYSSQMAVWIYCSDGGQHVILCYVFIIVR